MFKGQIKTQEYRNGKQTIVHPNVDLPHIRQFTNSYNSHISSIERGLRTSDYQKDASEYLSSISGSKRTLQEVIEAYGLTTGRAPSTGNMADYPTRQSGPQKRKGGPPLYSMVFLAELQAQQKAGIDMNILLRDLYPLVKEDPFLGPITRSVYAAQFGKMLEYSQMTVTPNPTLSPEALQSVRQDLDAVLVDAALGYITPAKFSGKLRSLKKALPPPNSDALKMEKLPAEITIQSFLQVVRSSAPTGLENILDQLEEAAIRVITNTTTKEQLYRERQSLQSHLDEIDFDSLPAKEKPGAEHVQRLLHIIENRADEEREVYMKTH